eukprot:CAMPEP_0201285830 /NCGR_PEP_ID=MMETSP1317-20130820/113880_1 /ASSEMBLY_ACC=CAM_ASM_000770 /TAXON_ID=187299 /ORGANISM="Undescribed Undescribed, Strain Undescribed" /LENGTH=96 /DNA_ID=CAMNT_0047611851 /DNA_START=3258 /DNA_END=3548 /DNA_ORIENTATION=+
MGLPLLIEDIDEKVDPLLEPILLKQIVDLGNKRYQLKVGDKYVDLDTGFKLYITTKLPNPHYLPEDCIKVTLINFTVTQVGLEEQLLGEVVKRELP